MSFSIFFKNNRRNSHKNKLRTFEARGDENIKNIELQEKKSGSYKKSVYFCMVDEDGHKNTALKKWRYID